MNDGDSSYGGGFFWDGGGGQVSDPNNTAGFGANISAQHVGFQLVCGDSPCQGLSNHGGLRVTDIGLQVQETQPPVLQSGGLWGSSGWVRGRWPLSLWGDSPSGVCVLAGVLAGKSVLSHTVAQNDTTWHQCDSTGGAAAVVNTLTVPDGPERLTMFGLDAAGLTATSAKTLEIDNQPPAVAISGPTDAPSVLGPQTLNVSASAGPSGVGAIGCSLDGAPNVWVPAAARSIPVSGVGVHQLTCVSTNGARDAAGSFAVSSPATWTLAIREPAVASTSFAKIVDALDCHRVWGKAHIPARWVIARVGRRPVHVKLPAETKRVRVARCHPRYLKRRVLVHGHPRTERVIVLPHWVQRESRHVRLGATATVHGWLGTIAGTALAGQVVQVQTALASAPGQFATVAEVATAADGSWTATIPPGASRSVRVLYEGAATVEPAVSNLARVIVPAEIRLRIRPRTTHWGHTISIAGRLLGGHVPPEGALVELRVGWAGGSAQIGHVYARPNGRFRASYTFLRGNGTETYRIWATTVREGDYPYAVGTSRKIPVRVEP